MKRILRAIAQDLEERCDIDVSECFNDGTFSGAKKGDQKSEKLRKAKGPRSWQLQTALVFLSPYALKVLNLTCYRRNFESISTSSNARDFPWVTRAYGAALKHAAVSKLVEASRAD
ncbi:MAG: hypothetical protein V1754_15615 [Pseudomonadota bacterium]